MKIFNRVFCNTIYLFRADVIEEVDGKKVTGVRDILDAVGFEVGKELILKIKRNQNSDSMIIRIVTAAEKK